MRRTTMLLIPDKSSVFSNECDVIANSLYNYFSGKRVHLSENRLLHHYRFVSHKESKQNVNFVF